MTDTTIISTTRGPGRASRSRIYLLFFLLLALPAFEGCASRDVPEQDVRERQYQGKYHIEGVPFFRFTEQENSCGPSAAAAIIAFWHPAVSLEHIARVSVPRLRGSLPFDLQRFLSEEGFVTVSASGTIGDMKALVRRNVPVISLLDLGVGLYPRPHYVTVIGFDDLEALVIVHDGQTANLKMKYGKFVRAWERADNWMLVAVPAEQQE